MSRPGTPELDISKQPSFEVGSVLFEIGCGGLLPLMGYPSVFTRRDGSLSYDVSADIDWTKWNQICADFPDAEGVRNVIRGLLQCNPESRMPLSEAGRRIGAMPSGAGHK